MTAYMVVKVYKNDVISFSAIYFSVTFFIFLHRNRFHLRWGCREVLYHRSSDGGIYVTGLAMSKV